MYFTANRIRKIKPWMKYWHDFFEEKKSLHKIKSKIKTNARIGIHQVKIQELTEKEINWLEKRDFIVEKISRPYPFSDYYIVKW